jgi:hypothetical protein
MTGVRYLIGCVPDSYLPQFNFGSMRIRSAMDQAGNDEEKSCTVVDVERKLTPLKTSKDDLDVFGDEEGHAVRQIIRLFCKERLRRVSFRYTTRPYPGRSVVVVQACRL